MIVKILYILVLIGIVLWVAIGAAIQNDSGERCIANDGSIYGACNR